MTPAKTTVVLAQHRLWLADPTTGCHADLRDADLRGANLRGADLRHADLCHADLRDADLRHADLCHADLRHANLEDTCLVDGGQRHDGWRHVGHVRDGVLWIHAGCRYMPIDDARAHWLGTRPSPDPLGDESRLILDRIEQTARVRGLLPAAPAAKDR